MTEGQSFEEIEDEETFLPLREFWVVGIIPSYI